MTEQTDDLSDLVCEECGATLTQREALTVADRGGPILCTVHLADVVEDDEDSLGADTQL